MKCLVISILYFTLFTYFSFTCKALDVYNFIDTKAYSMGNTLSILPGFANPASHGFSVSRYFSLQYINRYGIKEMSSYTGIINFPNKYLNIGLCVSRFGMDVYHETLASLNIYRQLSTHISLGIRVNYLNLHYSEKEKNKSVITADIGLLFYPLEHFYLSILAINPLQTEMKLGEKKEKLISILSVGASYQINSSFLLTGEIEKEWSLPVSYKIGFEYSPIDQLSIRGGMFTQPFTPSFGVGLHFKPFTIDLAFSKHPVLGFRSCCGLQFNF